MWTFEHTQVTTAAPEAVWRRWAAVEEWPTQNPTLKKADLIGPFETGSRIELKPKKGPKSKLIITETSPNKSFTGTGKVPLGEIRVEHSMTNNGNTTEFTHRIVITGPLTKLFVKLFGNDMASVLPDMTAAIARQAESSK